jgi:hypothetical protein
MPLHFAHGEVAKPFQQELTHLIPRSFLCNKMIVMQRKMHYLFDQRLLKYSAVLRQWRIALFPSSQLLLARALEREWIWHVAPIFDCVLGP